MSAPSLTRLAIRSSLYFFRPNTALALGIAAATAVIVGALVVGDSVRGSLRKLVIDRLANVECLLHSRVFFDPTILSEAVQNGTEQVVPGVLLPQTTVERNESGSLTRASQVQLLAFAPEFWQASAEYDQEIPGLQLEEDEAAVNTALAQELGLEIGDEITVRGNTLVGVSGDNPLGSRDDDSVSIPRQKVKYILPDESVAGITFVSTQSVARNVFLSLATVQDVLELDVKVNAALVMGSSASASSSLSGQEKCDALNLKLKPSLEDYGLTLKRHTRIFPDPDIDNPPVKGLPPETVFDYYQLSSEELVVDEETAAVIKKEFGAETALSNLTYLANAIVKIEPADFDLALNRSALALESANLGYGGEGSTGRVSPLSMLQPTGVMDYQPREFQNKVLSERPVPYSIVLGVRRSETGLNLESYAEVPMDVRNTPYGWVNSWLAEQLDLKPKDWIQIKYFEPETVDGKEVEKSFNMLVVGIVPVTEPSRRYTRSKPAEFTASPTPFNDPGLTPYVPGVTDQDSISNWDVPFPLTYEIDDVDDDYWNNHRLTPKVFMPHFYAASNRRFGSRFGKVTAFRFSPSEFGDESELRNRIENSLLDTRVSKGLYFGPVRDRLLRSASGTTPFDMLFISLSFFVIVAALLLVFLLFKLGLQRRHNELGLLAAQGFTPRRIRGLYLREFVLISVVGSIIGIFLGLGYARLMVAGLETWWIGAISSQFLTFFYSNFSMSVGALSGFAACLVAIVIALRPASKMRALSMLRSQITDAPDQVGKGQKILLLLGGVCFLGAVALVLTAMNLTGMARAGCFFGTGMLLLAAALLVIRFGIDASSVRSKHAGNSILRLAWLAICRNPLRSTLSLGLLSVATFLIASMSLFQISPSEKGFGGFDLIGTTSSPIYRNIGSRQVREDALSPDAAGKLLNINVISMRARFGEDASCNNLFQATQPTILGVSPRLRELHDFAPASVEFEWAASMDSSNPWNALAPSASGERDDPIPVILDQNTAAWSLKQGASVNSGIRIRINNKDIFFRTVGLLSNSVLQGKLLIDQENFENVFPEIGGYSFFMVDTDNAEKGDVISAMEEGWSTEGLDLTDSAETLAKYLAVQNTYISAFQSLGALGLLLGTFGLAAVQVRSVMEREKEFALMRAIGFAPKRIALMLTIETLILLGGGLVTGILCAGIALAPFLLEQRTQLALLGPLGMLGAVAVVGFCTAMLAVRTANRQSVLESLRS